jgi:hypothetical protein
LRSRARIEPSNSWTKWFTIIADQKTRLSHAANANCFWGLSLFYHFTGSLEGGVFYASGVVFSAAFRQSSNGSMTSGAGEQVALIVVCTHLYMCCADVDS